MNCVTSFAPALSSCRKRINVESSLSMHFFLCSRRKAILSSVSGDNWAVTGLACGGVARICCEAKGVNLTMVRAELERWSSIEGVPLLVTWIGEPFLDFAAYTRWGETYPSFSMGDLRTRFIVSD
jgi:hypothetical protein